MEYDTLDFIMEDYPSNEELAELSTKEKQDELYRAFMAGDEQAGRQLYRSVARFMFKKARRWWLENEDKDIPLEDLVQEVHQGFTMALKNYDPEMDNKFLTYASWWMRRNLNLAVKNDVPIRGKGGHEIQREVQERAGELAEKGYGKMEALRMAEEEMFADDETSRYAYLHFHQTRELESLDAPLGEKDEDGDLHERTDGQSKDYLELVSRNEISEKIQDMMRSHLSDRESFILSAYFNIGDYRDSPSYTLEDLGEELGITRERVRQLKERAFEKLRQSPEAHLLREHI